MWMMGIANSYTMEASFGGSLLGTRAESHFSTQDYEQAGKAFCQTLLDFYDEGPSKEKLRTKILTRLMREGSNAGEPTNIKLSDYARWVQQNVRSHKLTLFCSDEGATSSSSSEEESKEDCDEVFLTVPPPSPALERPKRPPKPQTKKKPRQIISRSPTAARKTLPLCKTTLELSVSKEIIAISDSETSTNDSSDSEVEIARGLRPPTMLKEKKKKKKKKGKKRQKVGSQKVKLLEEETTEQTQVVSVLDLTTSSGLRAHSWHRTMVSTPFR